MVKIGDRIEPIKEDYSGEYGIVTAVGPDYVEVDFFNKHNVWLTSGSVKNLYFKVVSTRIKTKRHRLTGIFLDKTPEIV